jgi:site-specific recombinase XerD
MEGCPLEQVSDLRPRRQNQEFNPLRSPERPCPQFVAGSPTGSTSEFAFPSKRSKTGHITLTAIEKPFWKARTDAKLDPEHVLYSARYSFATGLLDTTGNLKVVMETLGHASIGTTQKYLHPSLKGLAEVVNERNRGRVAMAEA